MSEIVYSFLPMGRTGVGKSTFLNVLAGSSNQFLSAATGGSVTKDVISKPFNFHDLKMMLIDAPGFGDSDGEDQINMNKLTEFLKKHQNGLNAIAIVISFSDHRFDQNLQNRIKFLYKFFGEDGNFWDHVCVIVTHCPPYKEDIEKLKTSMTSGKESLKEKMLDMIKDVCNMDKYTEFPFFFFDSAHAEYPPTVEYLPLFKQWIETKKSFKTTELKESDVDIQYSEERTEKLDDVKGELIPIYEFIPGEPIKIKRKKSTPFTKKEKRWVDVERECEIWVDRDVDAGDVLTLGIARIFRDNKVKKTITKKVKELKDVEVIDYREEWVGEFSGEVGKTQKNLKGYFREITSTTKKYTACWKYNCPSEDIKNRKNPTSEKDVTYDKKTRIAYYDKNGNELSDKDSITELKKLAGK